MLKIAARRSVLARVQAALVGEALQRAHPVLAVEYSFRESLGDRNQNDPLWRMPEKGIFTQDFREDLLAGRCDLVVHSWKDLPLDQTGETEIAATLARADARDVLLVREDRWQEFERAGALVILTSAPRRTYNLGALLRETLPAEMRELRFEPVRGSVPTRIRKMWQPGADGLIVAKAALDRLLESGANEFADTRADLRRALSACRWMILPLRANPSAPAQGALAVEIVAGRNDIRNLLAAIHCPETYDCVTREREILRAHGGGCHQRIGVSVLRRPYGEITFLRGVTDDGTSLDECMFRPSHAYPPRVPRERMWPLNPLEGNWFTYERIPAPMPDRSEALWIAKADAVPGDWQFPKSPQGTPIVWASGLQTWRRLAKRGIWVNGCAESLGEQEDPAIETIAGGELQWLKITHAGGYAGSLRVLATYRLNPKDRGPDLQGREYFFWMSGSGFERALALNPWLRKMTHFCGPGNTSRILENAGVHAVVCLDHTQWLKDLSL